MKMIKIISSWNNFIQGMTDEEAGRLTKYLFLYVSGKKLPQDRVSEVFFQKIKKFIDDQIKPEPLPGWKSDYGVYIKELTEAFIKHTGDAGFISEQEKVNPGIDIVLSIKKSIVNFWGTERGWIYKKKQKAKEIDWKATFRNAIGMNKVYKKKGEPAPYKANLTDEW